MMNEINLEFSSSFELLKKKDKSTDITQKIIHMKDKEMYTHTLSFYCTLNPWRLFYLRYILLPS